MRHTLLPSSIAASAIMGMTQPSVGRGRDTPERSGEALDLARRQDHDGADEKNRQRRVVGQFANSWRLPRGGPSAGNPRPVYAHIPART